MAVGEIEGIGDDVGAPDGDGTGALVFGVGVNVGDGFAPPQ